MNRTVTNINREVWYHKKTVDKLFKEKMGLTSKNVYNNEFDYSLIFVVYQNDSYKYSFVEHPKTHRIKYSSLAAIKEVMDVIKNK